MPGTPPSLIPGDPFDEALRALVHPPAWPNPPAQSRYDLVVVGAGTGGLVSAAIGAALGARVALVERHLMGGDCLNVGCVPSKAILAAARAWTDARGAAARVGGPAATGDGHFGAVMERMRRLRAELAPVDSAARFRELGVDVIFGEAVFTGRDRLVVADRALSFRRAIVASGARAAAPPIPGLADAGYLTNETIFTLIDRPPRMAVIGAGPIGCELAQAFARLGVGVTLLSREPQLLPREDPEAAAVVARSLARDGVRYISSADILSVDRAGPERRLRVRHLGAAGADGIETLAVEVVLVAAGRLPNVEGMGLAAAGVAVGPRGVQVDDRLRTSNRRIYAVGDVSTRFRFTHMADAEARLAVANALFWGMGGGRVSRLVVPWCTYTTPEVAHVGLTAADAAARGAGVETITVPMREVDRAVLDGATEGFVRLHLARGSDRILGATIVAEHAGDLLAEITLAMTRRLGLGALGATIHPYPTRGEAVRKAADQWRRHRLTPRARRFLATLLRIVR